MHKVASLQPSVKVQQNRIRCATMVASIAIKLHVHGGGKVDSIITCAQILIETLSLHTGEQTDMWVSFSGN